jgi:hypothetical protein
VIEPGAEGVLEFVDLPAEGGLLFVKDTGSRADALVDHNVIKKFQVMNVHAGGAPDRAG